MLGSILAAAVSFLIFASWFVLPAETEPSVSVVKGVTIETEGVGRVATYEIATERIETSVDTTLTETAENEPYIAPQAIIETEAVSASYRQVTGKLETEELVEVFPEADPIVETDIDALIVQVAGEYGLPWQLVRAVCWVESRFDPYARSDHPDYGLMQVWSEVWRSYGYDPNDSIVYDPLTNLRMGCTVLKDKIVRSDGELNYALTRYRFGDGDALARWANGDRTSWYAEEVLERYYAYMRGEY